MRLSPLAACALLLSASLAGGAAPPPKPPSPIGSWPKLPVACLTLDTNFSTAYAPNTALYNSFIQTALSGALNLSSTGVEVLGAQAASATSLLPNGTAVTFQLVSPAFTSVSATSAVASLFQTASSVWKPAYPTLVLAFMRLGLPVHVAYNYCAASAAPPLPPPIGAFLGAQTGLRIAFDIPYAAWKAFSYNAAVQAALAEALGLTPAAVQVTQVLPASSAGTILVLNIATPAVVDYVSGTSTDASGAQNSGNFPAATVAFGGLFTNSSAVSVKVSGFNAVEGWRASPPLLTALRKYGLQWPAGSPLNAAYFIDQPASVGR